MLLYTLKGERINDSWYVKDGDTYHTFFLRYPADGDPRGFWSWQSCAHMTSRDLVHWEDHGIVLAPETGIWNDVGIATGSVVKHEDTWYMLYTAGSSCGKDGLGLAKSADLMTWERVGDGPVIPRGRYPISHEGRLIDCYPLADPYIYPEAIDGRYYIFINSHAAGYPINARGTTAVFTTRDFVHFHPYCAAIVEGCDRMETVCVWKRGGIFYMYAGIVTSIVDENDPGKIVGQRVRNAVYTADSIAGPYRYLQDLELPGETLSAAGTSYIAKVLTAPEGREVLLMNLIPFGVIGPYAMTYGGDGRFTLSKIPEYEEQSKS